MISTWWGGGPGQTSFITARNKSMVQYAKNYPHSTRSYGAFGSDFIKESAKKDQPFCLSISFKAPHRPVQPDPLFDDIYAGALFPKPENFGREHGMHFPEQSRRDDNINDLKSGTTTMLTTKLWQSITNLSTPST